MVCASAVPQAPPPITPTFSFVPLLPSGAHSCDPNVRLNRFAITPSTPEPADCRFAGCSRARLERPARTSRYIERIDKAARKALGAGPGDHGGVISAQGKRRRVEATDLRLAASADSAGAQPWLAATPPATTKLTALPARPVPGDVHRLAYSGRDTVRRRPASKPAHRSATSCFRQGRASRTLVPHRGLEACEREVRLGAAFHRTGKVEAGWHCPAGRPSRRRARRDSGRPSSLAVLSKASPSASSIVVESRT